MIYSKSKIERIKEQYGLPCYVFDEEAFRNNYQNLKDTLTASYSKYEIAYSYKTNYAPKICSVVKSMGGYAEVVSDMEYEIAKIIGYENDFIVYNGPFKGPKMEEHLCNGGILNIDNLEELNRVICFANEQRREFKVGLRLNINVGQKFISRFGIDAESEDLEDGVNRLRNCQYTRLVGLHCHIGQSRSLAAWKARTTQMLTLADKYIDDIPEYIDLGSGMFGDMAPDLLQQFTVDVPTYSEYARVTAKLVAEHYKDIPEEKKDKREENCHGIG